MSTYAGLKSLIEEPQGYPDPYDPDMDMPDKAVDRSAKVCGISREALLSNFCAAADAAKDWNLAEVWCPKEGKAIFMRECLKRILSGTQNGHPTPKQCEESYSGFKKEF
jgi:hypothetical protein